VAIVSQERRRGRGDVARLLDVVFSAYVALLLLTVIPPVWIGLLVLPRGALAARLVRAGVRLVIRASGCSVRVRDVHRPATGRPIVIVANHGSYLDSVVLMATLPVDFVFVANHKLAAIPFFGLAVRRAGHLVVDRTRAAARRACVLEMIETLRRGRSLVVFPEGTRHRGNELLPFRLGAFRAAVEVGCPIVPVTINGTTDIWPPGTWLMHRGAVDIAVHHAVEPVAKSRNEVVRLRDAARVAITGETE